MLSSRSIIAMQRKENLINWASRHQGSLGEAKDNLDAVAKTGLGISTLV